ncbi:putative DNA metabolism protein [Ruminiclostridium sufflavum DSM 19573]|uniref:Putative DNA metabolism protein n=1 Tax=Ruminiclostridium sufflavum DSM 19573 TaxID=1121337 RepID=A0A318Y6B1_9FIRM|nr:TIGR03915 family putative DNA repair protein [Ruminiclostridium sufflavum]PYG87571.1 putative DNA metabolism protein [Ruminiclostridium sufflavum DSM 19573]
MIYIYDGTWDCFLTAIHHYYYDRQDVADMESSVSFCANLIDEYREINTDIDKAKTVEQAILTKISSESLDNIIRCFFSEIKGCEMSILNYIKLGFKIGSKIDSMLGTQAVLDVLIPARKVKVESHRMLGLLRFELLENDIYYAPIQPDHNIITFIAPHFKSRFADQNWVIHDIKRNLAALYNKKNMIISYMDLDNIPDRHADELKFQSLWKNYFNHIAIKSRINPKLQKQFVPKRYWKHLTEKK